MIHVCLSAWRARNMSKQLNISDTKTLLMTKRNKHHLNMFNIDGHLGAMDQNIPLTSAEAYVANRLKT